MYSSYRNNYLFFESPWSRWSIFLTTTRTETKLWVYTRAIRHVWPGAFSLVGWTSTLLSGSFFRWRCPNGSLSDRTHTINGRWSRYWACWCRNRFVTTSFILRNELFAPGEWCDHLRVQLEEHSVRLAVGGRVGRIIECGLRGLFGFLNIVMNVMIQDKLWP